VMVALEAFDEHEDPYPGIAGVSLEVFSLAFVCEVSLPYFFALLFALCSCALASLRHFLFCLEGLFEDNLKHWFLSSMWKKSKCLD